MIEFYILPQITDMWKNCVQYASCTYFPKFFLAQFVDFISFFPWRLEITLLLITILTWWITALYKKAFSNYFKLTLISRNYFFNFCLSKCLFCNSVSKTKWAVFFFCFIFSVIAIFTFEKVGISFSCLHVFINLMPSRGLIIFVLTFSKFLTTFKTHCPCFFLWI